MSSRSLALLYKVRHILTWELNKQKIKLNGQVKNVFTRNYFRSLATDENAFSASAIIDLSGNRIASVL
jgi:hypothetical protein